MLQAKLTEDIIGAAMTALNKLKQGLDEKLYERALVLELVKRGHKVEQQRAYRVFYDGVKIGILVPNLIVGDAVIADPKVATDFNDTHVAQMIGYSNITGLQVALLLNFKHADLRWRRVVRSPGPYPSYPCTERSDINQSVVQDPLFPSVAAALR